MPSHIHGATRVSVPNIYSGRTKELSKAGRVWYTVVCTSCKKEQEHRLSWIAKVRKINEGNFVCRECWETGKKELVQAMLNLQKRKLAMKTKRRT